MTRVNLIPPSELYDQHLVAEYRELLMVPAALKRSLTAKNSIALNTIPNKYVLGVGHVRFFYNKGAFLAERYRILVEEMLRRGMKPDLGRLFPIEAFPAEFFNNWTPTVEEINISRQRIEEKVAKKPNWYRKTTKGIK
jgi:deoxyribonuclease (pyrimidine dimer)